MRRKFRLTFSVSDSTFGQIVWRQFDTNFVTGNDPDKVLAHPASDVRHDFVSRFQLDAEPGVGEGLGDRTLYFERFFFLSQL